MHAGEAAGEDPRDRPIAVLLGFGNFAGIREPDLTTLVSISRALSTTPNHLLGVEAAEVPRSERDRCRARLVGAIDRLSSDDLERILVQVEALGRFRGKGRRA